MASIHDQSTTNRDLREGIAALDPELADIAAEPTTYRRTQMLVERGLLTLPDFLLPVHLNRPDVFKTVRLFSFKEQGPREYVNRLDIEALYEEFTDFYPEDRRTPIAERRAFKARLEAIADTFAKLTRTDEIPNEQLYSIGWFVANFKGPWVNHIGHVGGLLEQQGVKDDPDWRAASTDFKRLYTFQGLNQSEGDFRSQNFPKEIRQDLLRLEHYAKAESTYWAMQLVGRQDIQEVFTMRNETPMIYNQTCSDPIEVCYRMYETFIENVLSPRATVDLAARGVAFPAGAPMPE